MRALFSAEGSNLPDPRILFKMHGAMLCSAPVRRDAAEDVTEMASGGARNRSGPQADPASGRSDRRGYKLTALPSEGYKIPAPKFPLGATIEDGKSTADRELAIWAEAWTTPQACAWSMEPWRWPIVAEYCRLKAIVELSPASSAALVGQLHRYRDQIGLTPAGLKDNGWAIAADEVAAKAAAKTTAPRARQSSRSKMKIVNGSGA